jgi:integrase/recombinase XerD
MKNRRRVVFLLIKFAIKDFLDDRKFSNLSKQSISSYENTLNDFHSFCIQREVTNIEDVTANITKSYLMSCQEKGNKPASINHKLRNLKVFYKYCCNEEILSEKQNPTTKLNYQKEELKIICYTDYHITQMLNYYSRLHRRDKTYFAYRDYVIIITLLGTGIRLGELCNVTWNDVDMINSKITVIGKKRIQRTIPLVDKLKKELLELRYFKENYFKIEERDNHVFTNIENKKLTENAVQNVFKRLKEIMNFKDVRLSCHTFRHTFAKNWIMSGGDIFSLQKILGHAKLEMTKRYADLFMSAIQEQNDKFNPLINIKI